MIALGPSPSQPIALHRRESTADERLDEAGRPGAVQAAGPSHAAGSLPAAEWGSDAALAALGLSYARKRLRRDLSDAALARRLACAVVASLNGKPEGGAPPPSNLKGPTATQQLLALLSSVVPQRVAQADEAEADSDDEVPGDSQAPSSKASPARTTTHNDATLTPQQKQAARSAQALPAAVQSLLAVGADTNTRDADGNTPLYLAVHVPCLRTALEVVHMLLCRGADPLARRRGGSPLHHAMELDRPPLVQRLLRSGAVPQRSARAALEPQRRLATFAARHGFGDEALAHMRRALGAAIARHDAAAVRGLLQHGLPADGALLFALVRQRRPRELVGAMLDGGADPNATDALGTHVLTLAVLQADLWLARALLAAGADPSVEEEDGRSILQLAREQGTDPAVTAALEAAAERAAAADGGPGGGSGPASPSQSNPPSRAERATPPSSGRPRGARGGAAQRGTPPPASRAGSSGPRSGFATTSDSQSSGWGAVATVAELMQAASGSAEGGARAAPASAGGGNRHAKGRLALATAFDTSQETH